MDIDEGSILPVDEQYRMVKKKYFCYLCQKEYNKMVNLLEPLKCEVCNEGFVELVEKQSQISRQEEDIDEEKRRVNEQYRVVFTEPQRMDLYDRSTNNIYGQPRPEAIRQQEEEKK